MTALNLNWIADDIWGIADDVLRDVYVRGKYRNVIPPMTVLRRARCGAGALQATVLGMTAVLDAAGIANQDAAPRQAVWQGFHSTSKSAPRNRRARARSQQLGANFVGEFRNQIPCPDRADVPVWRVEAVQVLEGVGW